jgi:hypothetical protein
MSSKPPTLAFDLERDLRTLAAMASNLTPYLYENDIYGYLAGDLPDLTLGGLLLRLYRLSRLGDVLAAEQQTVVKDAQLNFEAERSQWAVHYEEKLRRELSARLDALARYLGECREDIGACASEYPVQAEKRTIIKHLVDEANAHDALPDDLRERVPALDQQLKRHFQEGSFVIADDRLKPVYPPRKFWWLYGFIPETRD